MTARVALYARYSSDRQNARSIEDQVAVLTRHAAARGWAVVDVFSDAAISGAHMFNRPGLNAALDLGERGGFDILLAEDEDRIARNLEHQAHVFNRLRAAGIAIATLSTDAIGILEVGLKGVMNELYLDALSAKTKRGMASNAEKGLATGSRLYGYRSSPGGEVVIVEEEAAVVRRICEAYADGATPRAIAAQLNREGVPGPRGGMWNSSSINGSVQRGNGILNSEAYAGVKVYGRIRETKDRATGARRSIALPPEQWKRTPAPHLRIVPDEIWRRVRARKAREAGVRPERLVRRPGLLSGLLKCRCGASYTATSGGRLQCAAAREKGPAACTNRRIVLGRDVERRVLEGLSQRLLHPEAVRIYVEEYRRAAAAQRAVAVNRRQPLEKRIAVLERKAERLLDELLDLDKADPMAAQVRARIAAANAEAAEARAELAAIPDEAAANAPIQLHPEAAAAWRRQVEQLHAYLSDAARSSTDADRRLVDVARGLIDRIEIQPTSDARGAPVDLILHGRLAGLMDAGEHLDRSLCTGALVVGGHCSRWHTSPTVALRLDF
ncbi:recombinase family protein [Brevundimonas sp.]|uniref:recombinase family protein n=1 Tax=Brevundimonas sp. TaxID=1871086 RepID=UPI002D5E5B61|nr:recombinase family protein [Brevundimonas sp.]HYD26938.1 recombinase family protein [Brevundimonas sp.]